jgi:hypothetical protein
VIAMPFASLRFRARLVPAAVGLAVGTALVSPLAHAEGPTVVAWDDAVSSAVVEVRSPPVLASALAAEPLEAVAPVATPAPVAEARTSTASTAPLRWTASAALFGPTYEVSLQRGAVDIGMRLNAPASVARPFDARIDPALRNTLALPAISLGLGRGAAEVPQGASSLLARSMDPSNAGGAHASKVGIEWKPAESQMTFLREGLGLRLNGNDRMTVRLRKGVLGIYMQRKF